MENKESKPASSEILSLRPDAKLLLEENYSGNFSESYSSGPNRDVALFVQDKGTSVTQLSNVDYTLYSEGPVSTIDDTNQENKVSMPSWYVKHPSNSIVQHSVEFNSEPSKSPSQYPISETEIDNGKHPITGQDHHYAMTGSGIPEKYFLASPKEDAVAAEWHHPVSYSPDAYISDREVPPSRKRSDRLLHESLSYLRDISNIPSNRTSASHRNAASVVDSPTSLPITGPFTSSTPTSPYKIPVTTMPQFYWTITQQRREPMGSESTDSPGYSNTPLAVDSPSIVTAEQPGIRESADYEQLPCTVVDITISPAASVTVYSDTDTVNADFRLIRPPLVGQSSDGAITRVLQNNTNRQAILPNVEQETEICASSPNSDDTFCEGNDINSNEKICAEPSNKQTANICMPQKESQDINNSVASKLQPSHNDSKNIHHKASSKCFKSTSVERDHKLITDDNLSYSYYNAAASGPPSLEYQQREPSTTQPTEESYVQSRYYLLPSGLQQALTTSENKHTKRSASLDSNEAEVESGKSGYQSDNRATSPTSVSSISSNRKLEWDNGADIGYNAVINAAKNKFISTFRSEPEGIPARCRDNITATTNTATVQQSSKNFHSKQVTSQENNRAAVTQLGENSLQVIGERVVMNSLKPNVPEERKQIPSEEPNHQAPETNGTNVQVQPQFSVRSVGSRSSAESLSSSSTVKLVNKVGTAENSEIRSSLSSPLSEPVGHTFGKLVHFDKSLLKSKSDSSTLDVSSSVTACMPESRPASTPYVNGSIYYDKYDCNDGQNVSQHQNRMEDRSLSPAMSHSSIDDDDYYLSDQDMPLALLKSNAQLELNPSVYTLPASVFVQGVNVPNHGVLLAKSNISKSLSNLYDSTNKVGPTSVLLPDDILPPEIRDISSLRMYLEERYHNELSGLPSNASPNENILMLEATYEELEKDGLLTDGPKIRWYPVTGSELPQDIRDASTQTAVSYLTQHGIQSSAVSVGCAENRTRNGVQMASVGISAKESSAMPGLLQKQNQGSSDVPMSLHTKQLNGSNNNIEGMSVDTNDNTFVSRKDFIHRDNTLQIHSKQIPIYHPHAYKAAMLSKTKNSTGALNMDLPIMQTDNTEHKCIASSTEAILTKSVIPNTEIRSKHLTTASFSDGEMCETKSIQTSRANSIPLQLPPLSTSIIDKFAKRSCDAQTAPLTNNPNNVQGVTPMIIQGTRLANSIENGYETITCNGFPKLDSKCHLRPGLSKQFAFQHNKDSLNVSKNTHRRTATTKLAASTSTVPSIVPVTNLAGNQSVSNVSGIPYDIPSVHREILTSNGGILAKTVEKRNSESHPLQYDLSHCPTYRRRLPHTEVMCNVQSFGYLQDTSVPPYSSEYSKWKVVTEENELLESSSSASVSSETESHFLLDEKLSKSQALTNGTSELTHGDDRMKTQRLMSEIKSILSKRTSSSKKMRKYAISNEADSEKSAEHHTMPSIHSETTMESTHTGSDDAEPPSFPPHAFGSRLNVETLSPGIYGTRKYMEKYGRDINQKLKRMNNEKEILLETENNGNLISDANWNTSTSKPDMSSHSLSKHQMSSSKSDSEHTITHSQTLREEESTLDSEDKFTAGNSNYRLQGVGQDTSSVSLSTQGQTTSTQDQTTLSSSVDGMYKKSSFSISSSNKSNSKGVSKTDSSESALTDPQLLNRLLIADFGASGLKPSQLAKRELEKLRHLVDRQKRSYIRRLQREVQRLERFEEVFLSESMKRLSSSSHCTLNNATNAKANGSVSSRNGYHSGNGSSISVPDSFLTSGNDAKHIAVPKSRIRKLSSRRGSALTNATRTMKYSPLQQVNDFGQSYPTPQPSLSEVEKETADQRTSVGIQTSFLQPNTANKLLSKRTESRFFITLDPSTGRQRKGEATRSSKYKDKTLYVRKRKPSSHTVPKTVKQNIAWFVPISSKKQHIRSHSRSRLQGRGCISLQEAFHLNCGHVIKHSQARLIRISKLADIRQKQTALAMEKARAAAQLKAQKEQDFQKEEEEKRRAFTHEEMREQTEKVYKKLPEVVEKKEKKRRDQQYKTNRLMAQIYNKKLQEQVLRGKVNWAITQSCFDGDD